MATPRAATGDGALSSLISSRMAGPAAVIDKTKETAVNPDYLLDVSDLEEWQEEYGVLPASGWLLFRRAR